MKEEEAKLEFDDVKLKLKDIPQISEQDLAKKFEQFGPVQECTICIDPITKAASNIGFITFQTPNGLKKALLKKEIFIKGKLV